MRHLVPGAGCLFDMKEGAFLPIRKPRDFGSEDAKYKLIDRPDIDGIAEWRANLV